VQVVPAALGVPGCKAVAAVAVEAMVADTQETTAMQVMVVGDEEVVEGVKEEASPGKVVGVWLVEAGGTAEQAASEVTLAAAGGRQGSEAAEESVVVLGFRKRRTLLQ